MYFYKKQKPYSLIMQLIFIVFLFSGIFLKKYTSYDEIRYIPALILILFALLIMVMKKIKLNKILNIKETVIFLCSILFLTIISIIMQLSKQNINFSYIKESAMMILPILIVFAISVIDKDNINVYANIYLIATIFDFFIRYINVFTLHNILSVSFINSYSPFESELVNIFLSLEFYYLFVNKNFLLALVSMFFCHLSMKRIQEIFMILFILFFITQKLWNKYNKISSKFLIFLIVLLALYPIFIEFIISNDAFSDWFANKFNVSLDAFTLGRENIYKTIFAEKDKICGLGSTRPIVYSIFGTDDLHNDLLRIYWECSFLGLFIFIIGYFYYIGNNIYALLFMSFTVCVMMISPILASIDSLTCIYFILFTIKQKFSPLEVVHDE